MSLTLATVADALIEFILSLLRDPDVAAEFEDDPEQALATRGLQHAGPADVAAVAPVIIERTQVVQVAVPKPVYIERDHAPVVREIKQVTSHFQWVDDRDTIVDQSVNQNIWAEGDVTQTFDNEAIVASGDEAVAAGEDATIDKTWDQSTIIEAGEDVNIGNDTDVEVIDDSMNEDSDTSTTTDDSTVVVIEDSLDEVVDDTVIDGSFNDGSINSTDTTQTGSDIDADAAAQPIDQADQQFAETPAEEPIAEEPVVEEVIAETIDVASDASAQYVEAEVADDTDDAFTGYDSMSTDTGASDENF